MRNEMNFVNVINHDNVALEADFRCDCGGDTFQIFHSGKLRRSIFGGVSIRKKEGQLGIRCRCAGCQKQYTLLDSTKDGAKPKGTPAEPSDPLEINGETLYNVKLKYNFFEEHFKTDRFEMFMLEVKTPNSDRYVRVCEY